jgi:hypothetical protein
MAGKGDTRRPEDSAAIARNWPFKNPAKRGRRRASARARSLERVHSDTSTVTPGYHSTYLTYIDEHAIVAPEVWDALTQTY